MKVFGFLLGPADELVISPFHAAGQQCLFQLPKPLRNLQRLYRLEIKVDLQFVDGDPEIL